MKKFAAVIACFVPLLAAAQAQETIPGVTIIAPTSRSVPASAVDADSAYIEYTAEVSNGDGAIELGHYLNASDCTHRLEQAFASPEFSKAIHERAILQLVCVATRKKA